MPVEPEPERVCIQATRKPIWIEAKRAASNQVHLNLGFGDLIHRAVSTSFSGKISANFLENSGNPRDAAESNQQASSFVSDAAAKNVLGVCDDKGR